MAFVTNDGVRIHYEVEGVGTPILFHTGAGGDLEMWAMAGYLGGLSGVRAILLDHRGHGGSDRPSEVEEHRIERYVADAVAVLDAVGTERVVLVGYSDGALVGSALASAHPDRVSGLVWIGAVGPEDESMRERLAGAAWIREHGMAGLVRSLREEEGDDVPEWFAEEMLGTDPEMFALELEGWADWSGPWSTFADIQAPTLIVVGDVEEGRPGVAGYHAEEAAETLPQGRSVELPGVGHVGAFVRSNLVIPELRRLIRDTAPQG